MKKLLLPCVAAAFAAAISHAAPAGDLTAAAKKLSDAANYGWTATTEIANSQFPAMPADGKTEKTGFTVITRSFNGNSMQTVIKGGQAVLQNPQGEWMTMEEMRQQFANRGGGGGGGGRGGFGIGLPVSPAEEVADLASKIKDAKVVDGVITATLSAEDAAPLLTFGGRGGGGGGNPPPAPANASGSVKFWVKDGALVKYVVNVKGTVSFGGAERDIDRTTTTEIKDVGTTKVEVPAEAKKKLGA